MLRLTLALSVLVGSLAAGPSAARAQAADDDSEVCSEPTEAEAHARAIALEAEIDPGVPAAARWWWGWLVTYAGLAIAQGVVALAIDTPEVRWPAVVGGASALLGIGGVLISPIRSHGLSAKVRELAPLTGRARLRSVERELAKAAAGEDEARNVLSHALGWGAALGGGLVLWLGFDQLLQGALNVVESVAVSELQIALAPTAARELWRAYVALHPDAAACIRDDDESSARAVPAADVRVRACRARRRARADVLKRAAFVLHARRHAAFPTRHAHR